jgi:hypothetical protein
MLGQVDLFHGIRTVILSQMKVLLEKQRTITIGTWFLNSYHRLPRSIAWARLKSVVCGAVYV